LSFLELHPVLVVSVIKVAVLVFVLMTAIAYITWFERKAVARMQSRWGPYRAGPHGLLQPLADGVKFLFKEDFTPGGVDKFVYFLAPFLALALSLLTIAVIPFGPEPIEILGQKTPLGIADINIGLLFLFAVTSLSVYSVALGGWASNSKYPLLGGLRSSAQMISYELSMTLSVVGILLMTGTFSLREIVNAQEGFYFGFIPRWNIFAAPFPQWLGFMIFFTAAVAETNRLPFDLAEAETELVAGFHTEYASFKFAMFFMAEYASMLTVCFVTSILFLGGWHSPFPANPVTPYLPTVLFAGLGLYVIHDGLRYETVFGRIVLPVLGLVMAVLGAVFAVPAVNAFIQPTFWLLTKVFFFLFIYIWVRGTLPRFRYDQLMALGWKLMLPLAVANVVLTAAAMLWAGGR